LTVALFGIPPAVEHAIAGYRSIKESFVREILHLPVLPTPSGVAIEYVNAVRCGIFCILGCDKGEGFIGVGDGNVSADNGCDLVVGNPSNKVKNGAWEVGIYAIPMVSAIKSFVTSYRFIKTNALLVGLACLIGTPRKFMCLRNNDSSFLKNGLG
jgi:hypothetical protein